MNTSKLQNILKDEPKYRLKQAKKAVFVDLISNWDEAATLPLNLREMLNKEYPLFINGEIFESKDKESAKAVIALSDGLKIETVLMRHPDGRATVCISSQVGCAMDCKFCATGKMGFKRNLTADEIVEQVLFWARPLEIKNPLQTSPLLKGRLITNVVFMGMGEPFLNYENVLEATKILNDPDGLNIGARKISVSTCGIIEGIEKFADEKKQINLAISLHAPTDELRSKIMPVNKKYPIAKVLEAIDDYIKKTSRRVMFEYLLIDKVNDSPEQAKALAWLMKRPLYMVNLIVYNPTEISDTETQNSPRKFLGKPKTKFQFLPSSKESAQAFKKILENHAIPVTQRHSFGQDINAACGQLVG